MAVPPGKLGAPPQEPRGVGRVLDHLKADHEIIERFGLELPEAGHLAPDLGVGIIEIRLFNAPPGIIDRIDPPDYFL